MCSDAFVTALSFRVKCGHDVICVRCVRAGAMACCVIKSPFIALLLVPCLVFFYLHLCANYSFCTVEVSTQKYKNNNFFVVVVSHSRIRVGGYMYSVCAFVFVYIFVCVYSYI